MDKKYKQGDQHPSNSDKLFWRYQKENGKLYERWVTLEKFSQYKERVLFAGKKYISNPENYIKSKHSKKRYRANPLVKEYEKNFKKIYLSNPDTKRKYQDHINLYYKKRRLNDPLFKLRHTIRVRLLDILDKNKWIKKYDSMKHIGCTAEFLKEYLESKFLNGMSWGNHGIGNDKWHIDHIIPLDSAKTYDELLSLTHWSNLQPLWAIDNIKKGNKIL